MMDELDKPRFTRFRLRILEEITATLEPTSWSELVEDEDELDLATFLLMDILSVLHFPNLDSEVRGGLTWETFRSEIFEPARMLCIVAGCQLTRAVSQARMESKEMCTVADPTADPSCPSTGAVLTAASMQEFFVKWGLDPANHDSEVPTAMIPDMLEDAQKMYGISFCRWVRWVLHPHEYSYYLDPSWTSDGLFDSYHAFVDRFR